MPGVYIIRNSINGKRYIGSSQNCDLRLKDHINALRRGDHINIALMQEWDKFGNEAFEFAVITDMLSLMQAKRLENKLIELYGTCDPDLGYNNIVNGRWSTAARLRNSEKRLIAKRRYALLPGVQLNDPMTSTFIKSARKGHHDERQKNYPSTFSTRSR